MYQNLIKENDSPIAVFTELLGRILDLDVDDWEPTDNQMVITVFQYAAYFLTQGRWVAVKENCVSGQTICTCQFKMGMPTYYFNISLYVSSFSSLKLWTYGFGLTRTTCTFW